MESPGERASEVPPVQRRQVLRPGVRIVCSQFDPEPHPDVEYYADNWSEAVGKLGSLHLGRGMVVTRRFGTSVHSALEASIDMERVSGKTLSAIAGTPVFKGATLVGFVSDENDSESIRRFGTLFGSPVGFSWSTTKPPAGSDHLRLDGKVRNDGKKKRPKQEEPFYVKKTKRKRR